MAVPSFSNFFSKALECVDEHDRIKLAEVTKRVADKFELSEEERKEKIPSGRHTTLYERTSWALSYLKHATLIESPKRGHFLITDRGKKALADGQEINEKFLEQFKEFRDFKNPRASIIDSKTNLFEAEVASEHNSPATPTEKALNLHMLKEAKLEPDEEFIDIPSFSKFFSKALECVGERNGIELVEATKCVADKLELSEEERKEKIPSGRHTVLYGRTSWALSYLKHAMLIESPKRGYFLITDRGKKALADRQEISVKYLEKFKEFRDFRARRRSKKDLKTEVASEQNNPASPTEEVLKLHKLINTKLAEELIERVLEKPPAFLETLIVDLLDKMNYGKGEVLGRTGDEGIDGVINQDKLGVEKIYVQAKRYSSGSSVGSGDVRNFFGALSQKQCKKGIFFTTASFSSSAEKAAKELGPIVLIDGQFLAKLMIENNVGCVVETKLNFKKTDLDYFLDETDE